MTYKTSCGFRERINVCKFHEEDCTPEKCDMFTIEWTPKGIMERTKKEQADVKEINDKMQVFRLQKNTNNDEYKKLDAMLKDKVLGCVKLSKSYVYLKRCGKK